MGLQGTGYKFDIVFVIDATESMGPIINQVKEQALTFGNRITTALAAANKPVDQLRFRVIDFADFATEDDAAIRSTDFFTMPQDKAAFSDAINMIDWKNRGGDEPENALEALFVAMNSDWTPVDRLQKGRHIIVLMTNALPLHFGERAGALGYYPEDFPANVEELGQIWRSREPDEFLKLSPMNKRLLLFAPDGTDEAGHTWETIKSWEKTISFSVNMDEEVNFSIDCIVAEIVRSI